MKITSSHRSPYFNPEQSRVLRLIVFTLQRLQKSLLYLPYLLFLTFYACSALKLDTQISGNEQLQETIPADTFETSTSPKDSLYYASAERNYQKFNERIKHNLNTKSMLVFAREPNEFPTNRSEQIVYKTITLHRTDTLKQTIHEINKGKVAFYCPREMFYKETYDAYAFVSDILSDEDIKKLLINKMKEDAKDNRSNTNREDPNFLVRPVQFYQQIELKLENVVNGAFEIVPIHAEAKQLVNDNMENWHWKITPISDRAEQQLILRIIVYDDNGQIADRFNKTYHLKVKIRPNRFFHNTMVLLIENPAWTLGSIVIPLITFLLGRLSGRKKNKHVRTTGKS